MIVLPTSIAYKVELLFTKFYSILCRQLIHVVLL
jgi:hypothetical protein